MFGAGHLLIHVGLSISGCWDAFQNKHEQHYEQLFGSFIQTTTCFYLDLEVFLNNTELASGQSDGGNKAANTVNFFPLQY